MAKKEANGSAKADKEQTVPTDGTDTAPATEINPQLAAKIAAVRTHIRESFGKVAMAMMMLPRYRSQTLADLQHLVLEPLMRDRVAIAYPGGDKAGPLADIAGLAIWASVSEEVDAKIREQVQAGTFPIRLKAEDWSSGSINWLLDVIAPDQRTTANVIANFKQVVKEGSLRLHPIVTRLVDAETLTKMGAEKMGMGASEGAERESEAVN
ncbi:toxin-activating lysine-acyltransferase [Sphingobium chlorophenolicum]|uniref:RTX toxin-activating lysine-acyltransferase n=1 Tax=Sphingobium chlorophenolicum TaxID=46429 RepID=A0A081RCF2_SPHCR|nr:toxin-activating lysine-acyltransferase [Sphingobium chlorophenolicum]KEQ52875.1 ACP:hemolysin acyltransferase (hemolysin-activating protein) [Sphingobium chlorophenolicum]